MAVVFELAYGQPKLSVRTLEGTRCPVEKHRNQGHDGLGGGLLGSGVQGFAKKGGIGRPIWVLFWKMIRKPSDVAGRKLAGKFMI